CDLPKDRLGVAAQTTGANTRPFDAALKALAHGVDVRKFFVRVIGVRRCVGDEEAKFYSGWAPGESMQRLFQSSLQIFRRIAAAICLQRIQHALKGSHIAGEWRDPRDIFVAMVAVCHQTETYVGLRRERRNL